MKTQKILNRIFRYLLIFLFIIYLTLYFSLQTGYYEYENKKKNILTEEKIKQFEEDVEKGKDITIEDYLKDTYIDYGNKTSKFGKKLSIKFSKTVKRSVESFFNGLNHMIDE